LYDNLSYEPDLGTDVAVEEEAQLPGTQRKTKENIFVSNNANYNIFNKKISLFNVFLLLAFLLGKLKKILLF
jgi:hypothetical protein